MIQFSVLSSYLWTMCFAHYLYFLISRRSQPKWLKYVYHMISWIIPLLIAVAMCIIYLY